ncbi:MAG: thermonuclease family protein [Candidatus Heimdallarchaeota archaeon]|nr:thermonuclease family protein [Candidatus Heimdallarchaeota archaeon]
MKRITVLIFLFTFTIINFSCSSKSGKRTNNVKFFPVTKVIDGDTFWIDDGSEKGQKIRLIGVDAPESRNVFKKVVGYYGKESKEYMTTLLAGKNVRLEYDVDPLDQYGRTLAYVYLQDGTFVNAELVKQGYGMIMTVPPNVKYADIFLTLQQEARENNRGLWGHE